MRLDFLCMCAPQKENNMVIGVISMLFLEWQPWRTNQDPNLTHVERFLSCLEHFAKPLAQLDTEAPRNPPCIKEAPKSTRPTAGQVGLPASRHQLDAKIAMQIHFVLVANATLIAVNITSALVTRASKRNQDTTNFRWLKMP